MTATELSPERETGVGRKFKVKEDIKDALTAFNAP